ncbi:MAG: acyl-CoA thioesterase [Deltaproteobacteria bacterium]|jgi:acyl-CoA thioester hydrolase|nr:acyl-CoA thioesterase [Deltaproteobacteria bacterium]
MRVNSLKPFPYEPGAPAPLRLRVKKEIRFGECDPMGVVWHGNYAQYFEEAREVFSRACGLGFDVLQRAGVVFPVKTLFFDYCKPLRYGREYIVEIVAHWSEAMRVNAEYFIFDQQEELCTRGFSVQLLVDVQGRLVLDAPPFYQEFKDNWAKGNFSGFQNTQRIF